MDLNREGKPLPIITQPKSDMLVFNYTDLKLDFDKKGELLFNHKGRSIKIQAVFFQEKLDEPMLVFFDDTDDNYIWISDYEKGTKLRYGYRINISDPEHPKLDVKRRLFCGPNNLKEIATTLGLKIGDPPPVFTSPGGKVMNVINYTGTAPNNLKLFFNENGEPLFKHNGKPITIANKGRFNQEVLEKPMIIFDDPENQRIWICDYDNENEKVYYGYPIDISDPKHPKMIINDRKKATRAFLVNGSFGNL